MTDTTPVQRAAEALLTPQDVSGPEGQPLAISAARIALTAALDRDELADIAAQHQVEAMGGSRGDLCRCGTRVAPLPVSHDGPLTDADELGVRKAAAMGAHQADALIAHLLGSES